jgi:hypothetical protein
MNSTSSTEHHCTLKFILDQHSSIPRITISEALNSLSTIPSKSDKPCGKVVALYLGITFVAIVLLHFCVAIVASAMGGIPFTVAVKVLISFMMSNVNTMLSIILTTLLTLAQNAYVSYRMQKILLTPQQHALFLYAVNDNKVNEDNLSKITTNDTNEREKIKEDSNSNAYHKETTKESLTIDNQQILPSARPLSIDDLLEIHYQWISIKHKTGIIKTIDADNILRSLKEQYTQCESLMLMKQLFAVLQCSNSRLMQCTKDGLNKFLLSQTKTNYTVNYLLLASAVVINVMFDLMAFIGMLQNISILLIYTPLLLICVLLALYLLCPHSVEETDETQTLLNDVNALELNRQPTGSPLEKKEIQLLENILELDGFKYETQLPEFKYETQLKY